MQKRTGRERERRKRENGWDVFVLSPACQPRKTSLCRFFCWLDDSRPTFSQILSLEIRRPTVPNCPKLDFEALSLSKGRLEIEHEPLKEKRKKCFCCLFRSGQKCGGKKIHWAMMEIKRDLKPKLISSLILPFKEEEGGGGGLIWNKIKSESSISRISSHLDTWYLQLIYISL